MGRWLPAFAGLALFAAIPFDALPWLRGPAPYPPEWQWGLRAAPSPGALLPAIAVAAAFLGLLWLSGSARAGRRPRLAALALLAGAMLLGFAFQLALAALEPDGPLRTLMARASSRTVSSYHQVAISADARDPSSFLARHAALVVEYRETAKHAATHPPGPVLFYRAAFAVCEASPALTQMLLRAADVPDRDFPPPNTRAARAAALLGALVLGFLGAATVWPLFALARTLGLHPLPAARVASLFVVLPGAALMTPQFDLALALPVTAAVALIASASVTGRHLWAKAILAGLCAALAVFTSYGAGVFVALGGVAVLALAWGERPMRGRGLAVLGLAATSTVAAIAATSLLGHDPVASARAALAIHRESYTAPRSYALWLIFNPIDLVVFLGVPVAVLGLMRLGRLLRPGDPRGPSDRFCLALGAGLLLLVLSGVTRGEVGRLWIPLMPLLLASSLGESPESKTEPRDDAPGRGTCLRLAALLALLSGTIGSFWQLMGSAG